MRSRPMNAVDGQGALSLVRPREPVSIPDALVARQQCMLSAVVLCVQASGLEDKEVYLSLGIDAGHWSRIMKGDAHFPVNKLGDLMDLCGNEAPLIWLAQSRGKGLVLLKSEAERRIEELETKLAKTEERLQWATDLVTRRQA